MNLRFMYALFYLLIYIIIIFFHLFDTFWSELEYFICPHASKYLSIYLSI